MVVLVFSVGGLWGLFVVWRVFECELDVIFGVIWVGRFVVGWGVGVCYVPGCMVSNLFGD